MEEMLLLPGLHESIPRMSLEDKVEQLLIEYKETPNPERMLYFYEEMENSWICPCGKESAKEERFCGQCGVSREWLIRHTNEEYLASKIIRRKGKEAVLWQKLPADEPQTIARSTRSAERIQRLKERLGARTTNRQISENRPSINRVDKEEWVRTRLHNYSDHKILRFLQYMVIFGTSIRRFIVFVLLLLILLSTSVFLIVKFGNREPLTKQEELSKVSNVHVSPFEEEVNIIHRNGTMRIKPLEIASSDHIELW